MSTQAYTNRIRVLAEARNNKIQQVGNIASLLPIQATACVLPNYSSIAYRLPPYCGGLIKPRCLKQ